jgi:hypothetical protein
MCEEKENVERIIVKYKKTQKRERERERERERKEKIHNKLNIHK